mmetsp:Transcript_8858/g.25792  ORF Transcript_8858/g.25792 Transcript_8858/m.25792 type:complete len:210 (-) Transcript_8858:398-1027(-)
MRSSLPQMMNIGHVTSFINSSGLGPGLPVKMFTKQASAPSFSAAWQMDFTRASSTRAGFLYTPASAFRTLSSERTLSKIFVAMGSIFKIVSIIARTTLKIGPTSLYCHANPSKSPGICFTLLFIPPAQLIKQMPFTNSGVSLATCTAAKEPIELPTSATGSLTTSETKLAIWSLQNSMEKSTLLGFELKPKPIKSMENTRWFGNSMSLY